MKKGFTLIEVLAVIVILSIISLIVFPEVNKIIKNSKQKSYDTQINNLIRATMNLAEEDNSLYPIGSDNISCISMTRLMQAGKIETDVIYDPRDTSKRLDGYIVISYNSVYNQYIYEYKDTCS